jgi:hypothetical protein
MVQGDWEVLAGLAVWRGGGAGWVWIGEGERGLCWDWVWGGGGWCGIRMIGMAGDAETENLLVMPEGKIRRQLLGWIRLDY